MRAITVNKNCQSNTFLEMFNRKIIRQYLVILMNSQNNYFRNSSSFFFSKDTLLIQISHRESGSKSLKENTCRYTFVSIIILLKNSRVHHCLQLNTNIRVKNFFFACMMFTKYFYICRKPIPFVVLYHKLILSFLQCHFTYLFLLDTVWYL